MVESTYCKESKISKVAIIDDKKDDVETEELWIEDAGLEPVYLEGPFKTLHDLITSFSKSGADSAICDHRLGSYYAQFDGAAAAATLFKNKIPAILVTQFLDIDRDTSIRRWRKNIPALFPRDEGNVDTICKAFMDTVKELSGDVSEYRRPQRALIRIQEINSEGGTEVIDALIPQWNPKKAVRFPIDLINNKLYEYIKIGTRFIANVNTGALNSSDLFFSDFELAPAPDNDI